MTRMLLLIAAVAACVAIAATTADARHGRRHAHAPWAASVRPSPSYGVHQEPARMIEVRPGLYISSYGCITDEGYGRYSPCDLTEGSR